MWGGHALIIREQTGRTGVTILCDSYNLVLLVYPTVLVSHDTSLNVSDSKETTVPYMRMRMRTTVGGEDCDFMPISLNQKWGLDVMAVTPLPFLSKIGVPCLFADPGGIFQDYIEVEFSYEECARKMFARLRFSSAKDRSSLRQSSFSPSDDQGNSLCVDEHFDGYHDFSPIDQAEGCFTRAFLWPFLMCLECSWEWSAYVNAALKEWLGRCDRDEAVFWHPLNADATNKEFANTWIRLTSIVLSMRKIVSNASYSASLFEASKSNLRAYMKSCPGRFLSTNPTPKHALLDAPSV
ncbi:hypothetical protein Tco_0296049 [Tanacetum coccineum]